MDKKTISGSCYQDKEAKEEEQKKYERMRIFTNFINLIKNKQEKPNQPIYVIVEKWLGNIKEIINFSTCGEEDKEEMIKIFNEKYKHGEFGITEASSCLYKITIERIK